VSSALAALYFAGGLVLLYLGGESLVSGAAAVGRRIGMTPLVAGLTIVAFATSAPELAVCLQAAIDGEHGLALGNVVGSNICNLALVLGLTSLARPSELGARFLRRDVPIMIASTVLVLIMLMDGELSRTEGGVLIAGIVAYLILEVRRARERRGRALGVLAEEPGKPPQAFLLSSLLLAGGLALLVWGGDLLVTGGVVIASRLGVPAAVVGLSVAALGTSLPELATSIVAARRGYGDMAVGNLVGSCIFNLLSILGITSFVIPLSRDAVTNIDLGVMFAVTLLVYPLMRIGKRIERWEGSLLVLIYVGYISWLIGGSASRIAVG